MKDLRYYVYIDTEKLYSFSSQVFSGVTKELVSTSSSVENKGEEQKGVVGSGQKLVDFIETANSSVETKYLHDYAFNLLEKDIEAEYILDLNNYDSTTLTSEILTSKPFIRFESQIRFDDYHKFIDLFKNFNTYGEALFFITNHENLAHQKKVLEDQKSLTRDKGIIRQLDNELKRFNNIKEMALEAGLNLDSTYLDKMYTILTYGFKDELAISQYHGHIKVTSYLSESYLREPKDLFVSKYGRYTYKKFVVIGTLSQSFTEEEKLSIQFNEKTEEISTSILDQPEGLGPAIHNLLQTYCSLEKTIRHLLKNELVIDPLAIYMKL
ncbi:hypothetical protein [Acinetobacter pittii]|uniref:DUF6414 family protein n=1 Tax=Acinetobacter pittii TaxID=48296 RepID=UPI001982714A|nr:hypothetical protein [Acinetobacter pittii]MBN6511674.1 hypothetical protein [Acinetobacter pittii]